MDKRAEVERVAVFIAADSARAADKLRCAFSAEDNADLGEFLSPFCAEPIREETEQKSLYVWRCVDKNGRKYSVLFDVQMLEAVISASTQMLELDKKEGAQ